MIDVTLDIETIPDQSIGAREAYIEIAINEFSPPSDLTKAQALVDLGIDEPDAIKKHTKESAVALWAATFGAKQAEFNGDEAWRKTSFDGDSGRCAIIGWAIADQPVQTIHIDSLATCDEAAMLAAFFNRLSEQLMSANGNIYDPMLIGHNLDFDLRFLFKRAVIMGIKPPISLILPRYSSALFCTMHQWAGYDKRISLVNLCDALDIPCSKNGMDGSQVWDYINDGRIAEAAGYCEGDVHDTRNCKRKMCFEPLLEWNKTNPVRINLPAPLWE